MPKFSRDEVDFVKELLAADDTNNADVFEGLIREMEKNVYD